ncbi:hypothetical protein J2X76_006236 [Neorhizobium sp. 2083]|uniref:hypothetical protein n=1 Tax=Neorhizobium sp. 2083 TaxID=2817762 RepID=UPI002860201E|nr:hypothetical protein [Neorhizobium sp. 2083]MDR6821036.1 hypothetical protein [Neorhizobium sp. 2083]
MTTIQSMSSFATVHRYGARDRTTPGAGFREEDAGKADAIEPQQKSEKLEGLQTELEALKKRELCMPISDYLVAKFTLQEQITTEKLNAGEKLDVLGIEFNGRVFQIGGKRLDVSLLKKVESSGLEMVQVAKPEDRLRNLLAQQS